jgi:hypothetical protein
MWKSFLHLAVKLAASMLQCYFRKESNDYPRETTLSAFLNWTIIKYKHILWTSLSTYLCFDAKISILI